MTASPLRTEREAPMRVLIVSNMYPSAKDPDFGTYVYDQVEELRRQGVAVELVVTDQRPSTGIQKAKKYLSHFLAAWRARRAAFDLIHLHFPAATHLLSASPVLLGAGRPYVVTIHGGDVRKLPRTGLRRWLVAAFLKRASCVIAVSRDLGSRAHEDLGVSDHRLAVIDVGYNERLFRPVSAAERAELRRQLGFRDDRFSLLYVGRIEPGKGLDTLFDALETLSPDCNAELFLAGVGPSEAELKDRTRRHRLREHIHWLGALAHDRLPGYYAAADAFVLPSRAEGTPAALLEAMAVETPAIVTRVGGVPDLIEDGASGLLFEPDDSAALRRLIERLATDRALGRRLARNAAEHVKQHTLAGQVVRIRARYHAVLSEGRAVPGREQIGCR